MSCSVTRCGSCITIPKVSFCDVSHADNQLPAELPFDQTELKQSRLAIHRGEDQAMQASLAAANAAAAGDRAHDGIHEPKAADRTPASSTDQASPASSHGPSTPEATTPDTQVSAAKSTTQTEPSESTPVVAPKQGGSQQTYGSSTGQEAEQEAGQEAGQETGPKHKAGSGQEARPGQKEGPGQKTGLRASGPVQGADSNQLADKYRYACLTAFVQPVGCCLQS